MASRGVIIVCTDPSRVSASRLESPRVHTRGIRRRQRLDPTGTETQYLILAISTNLKIESNK